MIRIDSLVRGPVGSTDVVETMRVFFVSPFGWVVGVNAEQRQRIMHEPELVEGPRPEKQRTDIPMHLRGHVNPRVVA